MKIRLNPLILGAFIVGAAVLAVVAFLSLGSTNIFHPTGHFIFYLPNSAQGVNAGTAVRLEGVRVGQVDDVRVLYDRQSRKSFVGVVCRINFNLLTDLHGRKINLTNRRVLEQLIADGLFAQVQTSGIVGAKYVEIGFHSAVKPISLEGLSSAKYPVVPTVPSTMSELTDSLSSILDNLRKTDFTGLAQQATDAIASARRQLDELETNRMTAHISTAAESLDRFMTSPDLQRAVTHIQAAATELQQLATNLNTQVSPLATNLNRTLASAGETARNLRDFVALRNQLGQQTQDLLKQLDRTARSIEQLADFLERHPNALLTGRARPDGSP